MTIAITITITNTIIHIFIVGSDSVDELHLAELCFCIQRTVVILIKEDGDGEEAKHSVPCGGGVRWALG